MPIHFECPNCRAKYDVADDMIGKNILCRNCEQRVAVQRPGAGVARTAAPAAAASGAVSRRKAVLIAAGILPVGFLGWFMGYYWKRPLPWERVKPAEDSEDRPRRRFRGGPPPDGQAPEGQAADGQPGAGGGRRGRGGRGRGKGDAPAPMQ